MAEDQVAAYDRWSQPEVDARTVMGNIGPRSFLHRPPRILPRPRANISQYGPWAQLVRGCYFEIS